ncbi:MAG: hypothetical protein ACI4S4_06825, partial [Candidatus Ornithospirochaeta sp.]
MTVIYSNFLDNDTEILRGIWKDLGAKVLEISPDPSSPSKADIDRAIGEEEDTLIVCGHGCPDGCFSPHFDYTLSQENKEKIKAKRVIGIWCHASSFARRYSLSGFFSSMFISNEWEAECMGIHGVGEDNIRKSEEKFVNILNSL